MGDWPRFYRPELDMQDALRLHYRMPNALRPHHIWCVQDCMQDYAFREHLAAIGYTGPVMRVTRSADAQGREIWLPLLEGE